MKAHVLALGLVLAGCASSAEPDSATTSQSADTSSLPTALGGTYAFETVRPLGRLTVDVIDSRMPDAASRLADLNAAGATCEIIDSVTTRCTKMHDPNEVPASSLEAIANDNARVKLSFGALRGKPSLTNDAESLREWSVPQKASGPLGSVDSYVFRQLDGGPNKIILGASDEYLVEDESHVWRWQEHAVSEGRWRFHRDTAAVVLTR